MSRIVSFPIELVVTPRFDVFYALYSLTSNTPTSLAPWKERALRRLPRDFERVAKRIAPLPIFWPLLADAAQSLAGDATFEEILSTIRDMPLSDLQKNILSGIFHDRGAADALLTRKQSLRQVLSNDKLPGGELLGHFGLRPQSETSPAARAIAMLLSKPQSFRDELALVLQKFWQTGFRSDWAVLEPRLRAESSRLRDLEEKRSPRNFGRGLNLPVVFDDSAREIRPKVGPPIAYNRVDRCYVIPSAFNTRRWWAKYETAAERVTLYLPITTELAAPNRMVVGQAVGGPETKHHQPMNAEFIFRALGDTTRYAIASILARTPTTSADLARSLKVSKPTISHHVQALRSAGLIAETPSGGSTKLSLSRDTVAALSGAAVEQLFSSTSDLTLVTTRKRHD
ncbi:MAG: hypothetical protein NVSMB53_03650 [Gemmatimonadaceae bacterium]